jgi:hypothetical protein
MRSPERVEGAGQGWAALRRELDERAASGRPARLWLRDDDAVTVTAALERLIELTGIWRVPVVLAVIPAPADAGLAARLGEVAHVTAAVHGYAHKNHAPPGERRQELGAHRPAGTVLGELRAGLEKLRGMFPGRLIPMLVPPWNRIADALLPALPGLGFRSLSAYGRELTREPAPGLSQINCRLDVIDWRATRGGLPPDLLAERLARLIRQSHSGGEQPIGILTHHLVHDEEAWGFLDALFKLTAKHAGAAWQWPDAPAGVIGSKR